MDKINSISLKEVYDHAGGLFQRGEFFCSEAVVSTMRKFFDANMPESLISAASGFPVGVGRQKCMCGAISGGVIALGYFFGRTMGNDPKVENTLKLTAELHNTFTDSNKIACCSLLTRNLDMSSGEHKEQCVRFTSEMASKTAEIIAREHHIPVVK